MELLTWFYTCHPSPPPHHSGILSRVGDVGWVHLLLPPALPALGIHESQHKRLICWKRKEKVKGWRDLLLCRVGRTGGASRQALLDNSHVCLLLSPTHTLSSQSWTNVKRLYVLHQGSVVLCPPFTNSPG